MYVLIKPVFSGYNEQCMLIQKMYRMDNFKIREIVIQVCKNKQIY